MVREYLKQIGRFAPAARLYLTAQFLFGMGQATVWVLRNLFLEKAGFSEELIGNTLSASAVGMLFVARSVPRFMDRMRLKGFAAAGATMLAGGLVGGHSRATQRS